MSDDHAAKIINESSGVTVKGVDPNRGVNRDPYRTVRIITLHVPPCEQYPEGANLFVHPKQVLAHQAKFPGATVVADQTFRRDKPMKPTDMKPEGHRQVSDIVGPNRSLIRSDDA